MSKIKTNTSGCHQSICPNVRLTFHQPKRHKLIVLLILNIVNTWKKSRKCLGHQTVSHFPNFRSSPRNCVGSFQINSTKSVCDQNSDFDKILPTRTDSRLQSETEYTNERCTPFNAITSTTQHPPLLKNSVVICPTSF